MTEYAGPVVGILWRGRPGEPTPPRSENRLRAIFDEFERRGARTEALAFTEERTEEMRQQMRQLDAVLTWVDPIVAGRNRTVLDGLLREIAADGVLVSAHPDVILKMGTKDVLVRTKNMGWGSDTYLIHSPEECLESLPARLRLGPRVLKQHRGSSGDGVWKVELEGDDSQSAKIRVAIRHALRGSRVERLALGEFVARCDRYFAAFGGAGLLIDQPYQDRIGEGMTRAYMAGNRVAGFGHQLVTALAPLPDGSEETPAPPPRYYFGPEQPEFQQLRQALESHWISELQDICGVETGDLQMIWDADFLLGPKSPAGSDSYVLCEINVSGVFPIPDESIPRLARWTLDQIKARREGT